MHMILFGLPPNTTDFIFGKKKVLVNHANDLICYFSLSKGKIRLLVSFE